MCVGVRARSICRLVSRGRAAAASALSCPPPCGSPPPPAPWLSVQKSSIYVNNKISLSRILHTYSLGITRMCNQSSASLKFKCRTPTLNISHSCAFIVTIPLLPPAYSSRHRSLATAPERSRASCAPLALLYTLTAYTLNPVTFNLNLHSPRCSS